MKVHILGDGPGEATKGTYLGRQTRWEQDGIHYEAEEQYAKDLLDEWGMQGCKAVASPGCKEEVRGMEAVPLDAAEMAKYRRAAATLNYIALDRPDIAFSAKEVPRVMSAPISVDLVRLKRILRYLKGVPRVVWVFRWQPGAQDVIVYVGSDWADV